MATHKETISRRKYWQDYAKEQKIKKLEMLADKMHCTLDWSANDITSPKGMIFSATECHYIVFEPQDDGWLEDAIYRLQCGLEPE